MIRSQIFYAAVTTAILTSIGSAWAGAFDAQDAIILATTKADHNRNVADLERLVNVNSGTLNLKGVETVAQMLRPEFEALGLTVRWIPMAEAGRAGHLVAEHKGAPDAPRILMIAHLDTVFEMTSPFQTFERKDDLAIGPGVNDIKGGDVVILEALRALKAAGGLDRANVTVYLSGDEERIGKPRDLARRDLIALGKASDVALDFENQGLEGGKPVVHTGRRSSLGWTLRVTGKSGHSAGVGKTGGYGAIYEAARIIDEFRRALPEPGLTYNVGLIVGGTTAIYNSGTADGGASGKTNVIAAEAVAVGDLRTLSNAQTESVEAKMRAIVAQHLDKTDATLTFAEEGYPAMAPSERNLALAQQLNAVNRDLGLPELGIGDPSTRGAGDIGFVGDFVPGLVGMGITGFGAHAVGETAILSSLDPQAARAAALILRLSVGRP